MNVPKSCVLTCWNRICTTFYENSVARGDFIIGISGCVFAFVIPEKIVNCIIGKGAVYIFKTAPFSMFLFVSSYIRACFQIFYFQRFENLLDGS